MKYVIAPLLIEARMFSHDSRAKGLMVEPRIEHEVDIISKHISATLYIIDEHKLQSTTKEKISKLNPGIKIIHTKGYK